MAAGLRIRRTTQSDTVDYLYDLAGHAITELNMSGAWTRSEVYAGSRHVATYKDGPTGATYFSHTDWLGTERVRTDKAGTTVESCTSLPFGDAQSCTGTSTSPLHFTGKERDTESDNDYFGARYYISRHGRWLTPDWSARQESVPYASLTNPQTLNLYAYVGNNPASRTDPDGHLTGLYEGTLLHGEFFLAKVSGSSELGSLPDPGPLLPPDEDQQQNQPSNQSSSQQSNQQKDSGIKVPKTPDDLGPEWKKDPNYKNPNGERYVNPNGDAWEWHKGQPGKSGEKGKDHWHWAPQGKKQPEHLKPGDTIKRVAPVVVTTGIGAALIYIAIKTLEWAWILAF